VDFIPFQARGIYRHNDFVLRSSRPEGRKTGRAERASAGGMPRPLGGTAAFGNVYCAIAPELP
jgi:hypothetical protein